MTGDHYSPTQLGCLLLLAGLVTVSVVVGVVAAGSLLVTGVRALVRSAA